MMARQYCGKFANYFCNSFAQCLLLLQKKCKKIANFFEILMDHDFGENFVVQNPV